MNVFNRIVMVLGILLLIALLAYVLILPNYASDSADIGLKYFGENYARYFEEDQPVLPFGVAGQLFATIFPVAGGVAVLVLIVLLVLEVRRPRRKVVRIKTQGGSYARLEVGSVAQSLEYRVDELAGVRKVKTHIVSRGKDVDVTLDLDTSPSVNIPVLTDQIIALCHDIVEGQLGIHIHGRPVINIKHEPYPRGTMPSTKPLGSEAVSATPPMANAPKVQAPSYGASLGLGEAPAADEQTSAGASREELLDEAGEFKKQSGHNNA